MLHAQVACGDYHTLAVTELGKVYSWGCGAMGQLGLGDDRDRSVPQVVTGLDFGVDDVVAGIDAGPTVSAAITDQGRLFMWGSGEAGQLGNGSLDDVFEPIPVEVLAKKVRRHWWF